MSFRDTATEVPSRKADWDGKFQNECQAYGCFLPASVITDYGEYHQPGGGTRKMPKAGICGFHFSSAPDQWQHVTKILRRHRVLLDTLRKMDQMPMCEQDRARLSMVDADPDTEPKDGEGGLAWKARMRSLVRTRIAQSADASSPSVTSRAPVDIKGISQGLAHALSND